MNKLLIIIRLSIENAFRDQEASCDTSCSVNFTKKKTHMRHGATKWRASNGIVLWIPQGASLSLKRLLNDPQSIHNLSTNNALISVKKRRLNWLPSKKQSRLLSPLKNGQVKSLQKYKYVFKTTVYCVVYNEKKTKCFK